MNEERTYAPYLAVEALTEAIERFARDPDWVEVSEHLEALEDRIGWDPEAREYFLKESPDE